MYRRLFAPAVPLEEVLPSCWPTPRNLLALQVINLFYKSTKAYVCSTEYAFDTVQDLSSLDYGLGDLFAYLHDTPCVSADDSASGTLLQSVASPETLLCSTDHTGWTLPTVQTAVPKTVYWVPVKKAAFRVIVERTLIVEDLILCLIEINLCKAHFVLLCQLPISRFARNLSA